MTDNDELEQRVITLFHESIEAKMQAGESLAPLIGEASQMIVHALLNGNKVLCCGNGFAASNAQLFATSLVHRFEKERPGLPAIALGTDPTLQSSIASESSFNEVYAKPIRALGQAGDVLLLIANGGHQFSLVQAAQAAHDRDMGVIALSGPDGSDIASLLDDINDIELSINVSSPTRVHEIQLLVLLCLCDLIDNQLFGS